MGRTGSGHDELDEDDGVIAARRSGELYITDKGYAASWRVRVRLAGAPGCVDVVYQEYKSGAWRNTPDNVTQCIHVEMLDKIREAADILLAWSE